MALDLWVLINAFVRLAGLIVPYVASRRRRLTWSMASFGLVILLLTSIGQLTWRDALVVLVVWSVGYFYASYLKSIRHAS